ncbi:hypothetical protein LTR55_011992 [Exophiala xenobiotica]|nr:hypothetical protein LTR55_011992 [Exophiala xenobiotica]
MSGDPENPNVQLFYPQRANFSATVPLSAFSTPEDIDELRELRQSSEGEPDTFKPYNVNVTKNVTGSYCFRLQVKVRVTSSTSTSEYTDVEMFPGDFQERTGQDPEECLAFYPHPAWIKGQNLWITVKGSKKRGTAARPLYSRAYKMFNMDKRVRVCIGDDDYHYDADPHVSSLTAGS